VASTLIEQALYNYLLAQEAVTTVFGSRLYFVEADQDTAKPYCVFFVVSDPHAAAYFDKIHAGQARIQFSIFDSDKYVPRNGAKTIRDELQYYRGAMDEFNVERIVCSGIINGPRVRKDIYHFMFDAFVEYWE